MPKYKLSIYPQEKCYTAVGEEIPHHTESFHASNDATATDEACSRYDRFAAELATQVKPKTTDPRLDRGELYEGDRAVCDIWRPLRRSLF